MLSISSLTRLCATVGLFALLVTSTAAHSRFGKASREDVVTLAVLPSGQTGDLGPFKIQSTSFQNARVQKADDVNFYLQELADLNQLCELRKVQCTASVGKMLNADFIIQMDSDGQHDPKVIKNFLSLTSEYDVVIGSRFTEGGKIIDFSKWRLFLSLFGNLLVRYLGGAYLIKDCTSGFRLININILKKCDLYNFPTKGYSFQSWLICDLLRKGASIKEVPITFEKRISGSSKLSFEDQIEFLINIFKIRFHNSKEFFNYSIVGSIGVLVNLGSYYILTRFLDLSPLISSPIAIEISILNNFLLNNYWTFSNRITEMSLKKRLLSFHIVSGASGLMNYSVFLLMLYKINLPDLYAVLFGITVGIIFNYAGNSLWTFRKVMTRKKNEI